MSYWNGQKFITSSLLLSVANPYQGVNNSSSFRSLVICFETAAANICVIFVRPHRYLFTILESGKMFLNSLAAWSAVVKGSSCSTRKPEKSSLAFTTFWSKFAVAELAPKLVNFFVVAQYPHIPYLWGVLVSIDIIFSSICNTEIASTHST